MSVEHNAPAAEVVLQQLERMLKSQDFNASPRNKTFLEYIVRETLAGRSDRIKAYNIATTVMGRGADFDPQLDSIVRIEAGRLRRSLERYYLMSGTNDPVRIAIPTGSYVPQFTLDKPCPLSGEPAVREDRPHRQIARHHRPGVFVQHFEQDLTDPRYVSVPRGLVRQIVAGLTRFPDMIVFGPDVGLNPSAGDAETVESGKVVIDYYLTGGVTVACDHFGVEVMLVDAKTGWNVWAETFARPFVPDRHFEARDEVAALIVRALAQPYGVIFSINAREIRRTPADEMGSFDFVMLFYQYRHSFNPDLLGPLAAGLEQAVVDDPDYSEVYACLSLVYVDSFRFRHPLGVPVDSLLKRAGMLARRAVELAPRSGNAFFALSQTLWYNGDVKGAFEALETGLRFNPNDTEMWARLGLRHAMRAEWDKGVPLLQNSYSRNPAQSGYYRIGLALWHFAQERYQDALAEALKTNTPDLIYGTVLTIISASKLGAHKIADAALHDLMARKPDYIAELDADLALNNYHSDLTNLILPALLKAGLPTQQRNLSHADAVAIRSVGRK